jgi:hypothetical protein
MNSPKPDPIMEGVTTGPEELERVPTYGPIDPALFRFSQFTGRVQLRLRRDRPDFGDGPPFDHFIGPDVAAHLAELQNEIEHAAGRNYFLWLRLERLKRTLANNGGEK